MTVAIGKLLEWETGDARVLYAYDDRAARTLRFDPRTGGRGAGNGEWYIESNAYGFCIYMAGVKLNDARRRQLGVEILRHGIERQHADGSFPCGDAHHSAAFFLEVLGRFLHLADVTGFRDTGPFLDAFRSGVLWFNRRSAWNDDWWRDTMHHRFFLNAAVLFLAPALMPDRPGCVDEQACAWLAEGIRRQEPDGAHTEFGGHDTGYHSLAMTFSAGALLCSDGLRPRLRAKLEQSLQRAADWIMARVGADGIIDGTGNARMRGDGSELDRQTGRPKGIKYYETAFALHGAALALDNGECAEVAARIMAAYPS